MLSILAFAFLARFVAARDISTVAIPQSGVSSAHSPSIPDLPPDFVRSPPSLDTISRSALSLRQSTFAEHVWSWIESWIRRSWKGSSKTTNKGKTDFRNSCGCTANSTLYPTAALSQAAYGACADIPYLLNPILTFPSIAIGTGPGCGACFNLTITNSALAVPQYTSVLLLRSTNESETQSTTDFRLVKKNQSL